MLPKACYWLEIEGAAYLRYNYATVASVRPCGERFEVCIRWGGRDLRAQRGSMERGRRDVERWVEHAKSTPGPSKRRQGSVLIVLTTTAFDPNAHFRQQRKPLKNKGFRN